MLKNKTVPIDQYEVLFKRNGHHVDFVPLLHHAPTNIQETCSYLSDEHFVKNVDRFIITSQRAVEVLQECLRFLESSDPEAVVSIKSKIGYTVGPATEKILQDCGFNDVRGGLEAGNGSKLADIVIEEWSESCERVVFFTGVIRKDIIPVKLTKNGRHVEEVVIYKTENRSNIQESFENCIQTRFDWIVFFSPQGTERIVEHLKNHPLPVKIASIGPTTNDYLAENDIECHVVAPLPTLASLLSSLQSFSLA